MKLIEQLKEVDYGAVPGRIGKWLQRVFGSANQREVTRLSAIVREINALEDWAKGLSAEQVRQRVAEWKEKVQGQKAAMEDALPEMFAMTREAGKRALNMRHFDAQLLGGLVLHQGKIAEMVTGEGKTLVATLAASLNALDGKGVYVVTVNDYLAKRDRDWMAPIFEYLGLRVGAIQSPMSPRERIEHYACDIVYGTNSEFGFDYLRDNMKLRAEDQVQKNLSFAIVDEVDSILIDEARTPLIISGPPEGMTEKYLLADRIARRLKEGVHFEVKLKEHQCLLSDEGVEFAEKLAGVDSFYSDPKHMDWPHHIETALRAHYVYQKDKDYVVKDNEVIIVDEFTGRLMPGRRWSDGLHQCVEVKEGIRPREENQTLATITYQNYFRLFKKLAGMTGTAMTEAAEFGKIYKLDVVSIPTNRKLIRRDNEDLIYLGDRDKYQAITDEIVRLHSLGRPVLVGTTSIAKSEKLSALLKKLDLPHEVLNAKHHEREAQIVAKSGEKDHITVATNMAGRGTDIKLGPGVIRESCVHPTTKETWCCIGCERPERANHCAGCFKKQADQNGWHGGIFSRCADGARGWRTFESNTSLPNPWPEAVEMQRLQAERAAIKDDEAGAKERRKDLDMELLEARLWWNDPPCGLHIVGTERHEARRIDNQLRGRTGRQGDPGSTRFFLCFDDDLMKIFARDWVKTVMERLGLREGERIESPMVSRGIARAQKKVEARHFDMRKNLLEYDEVMDKQRRFIYGQRQEVLQKDGLSDKALGMFEEMVDGAIALHQPDPQKPFEYEPYKQWLHHKCGPEMDVTGLEATPVEGLFDETMKRITALYDKRRAHHTPEMMEKIEQFLLIDTIDNKWKDHLHAMEALKEGIGLRSYAQVDPRNEYKKEGFQKFEQLKTAIAEHITDLIFKVELAQQEPARQASPPQQPRPQGPSLNLPQDPQMAIAMLEAMAAAGQLPPHIQAVLSAGGRFEVAGNQIRVVPPPGFQMPAELQAAAGGPAPAPDAAAPVATAPAEPAPVEHVAGSGAAPIAAAAAPATAPTTEPPRTAPAAAAPVAPAAAMASSAPSSTPNRAPSTPASGPARAAAGGARKPEAKALPPGATKPGRNDPCPCGSGLKYKKCCAPAFD